MAGPKGFAASIPSQLKVADLKPFHIDQYLTKQGKNWNNTTKGSAIAAIKRPFNWAVKQGYLKSNPVAKVERPPATGRGGKDEVYVPREGQVVTMTGSPPYRGAEEFETETAPVVAA